MGQDWNQPRDKGPSIEEPNRHRKKGGNKKPFIIERRYIGPARKYLTEMWENYRQWHVDRRYATEKDRDQALRALSRQVQYRTQQKIWEYRAV